MIYLYARRTGMGKLARELGISVSWPRREIAQVVHRPQQLIRPVNWGCARRYLPVGTVNFHAECVHSKVSTFRRLVNESTIRLPRWTQDVNVAIGWNASYLARRDGLTCGAGIEQVAAGATPQADDYDFYVKRIARDREFRVHVNLMIADASINPNQLIQAKLISRTSDEYPPDFTYTTQQLERFITTLELDYMVAAARRALQILELDFGAIDFIRSARTGHIYFLEVNTAPGIQSDAVRQFYTTLLRGLYV